MKHLKLYEEFDWNFDIEEENTQKYKKFVTYGNMTLEDINGDGSWYFCINCETEFSLSRQQLIDRGVIVNENSEN